MSQAITAPLATRAEPETEAKFDTNRWCTSEDGFAPVRLYWPRGIDADVCGDPDDCVGAAFMNDFRSESGFDALQETPWPIPGRVGKRVNIWFQPPYSRGLLKKFVPRAVKEVQRRRNVELIALLPMSFDTAWWNDSVWPSYKQMLIRSSRLHFMKNSVVEKNARHGNVYVRFSSIENEKIEEKNYRRFRKIFSKYGEVIDNHRLPRIYV